MGRGRIAPSLFLEDKMRELSDLLEDEKILTQIDNAIIAVMDIVRDETGLDCDTDMDDHLWGVVREHILDALAHAYTARVMHIEDEASQGGV